MHVGDSYGLDICLRHFPAFGISAGEDRKSQVKGAKPRMTICRLCEEQVPTNNPNSLLG